MNYGDIDQYGYCIPRTTTCCKCAKKDRCAGSTNKYKSAFCDFFEPSMPLKLVYGEDGIPVRSLTGLDYRTESQWYHMAGGDGYVRGIKKGAKGILMRHVPNGKKTSIYYSYEETERI